MVNADEALRIILDATSRLKSEKVRLTDSLSRVLAEDVVAEENLPPFDNSSMDGFAVLTADLSAASDANPVTLQVVGESSAGNPYPKKLKSGNAVRVMTGGKIPKGADGVVPIEAVKSVGEGSVQITSPVPIGQHVRHAGEDVQQGEKILNEGELIGPPQIGVLASLGRTKVRVFRKPLVNILATGDELAEVDEKLNEGEIRNSTSYSLAAYVAQEGGMPEVLGVAPDKKKRLRKRIREGLECDILLITGGVSVGKYDFVKDILNDIGVETLFWQINIKPGRPLVFGKFKKALVFGLPGNPVSTSVTFLQFVRPALYKMTGRAFAPVRLRGRIDHEFSKSDGKRHYLRCVAEMVDGELHARTTGTQSSGAMSSMSKANALMIIPEEVTQLKKGDLVQLELLHQPPL
jgi:molybdopterin molybdotransferase